MSRINPIVIKQQACPRCRILLTNMHNTQLYCTNCCYAPQILQQELRVVPQSYRSKADPSLAPKILKVRQHLQKFSSMCGFLISESDLQLLTAEVVHLHRNKGVLNRKGLEDISAVIIFQHFKEHHKMGIRQFCQKGGIKESKFNRFYIEHKMNKKSAKHEQTEQKSIEETAKSESKQKQTAYKEEKKENNCVLLFKQSKIETIQKKQQITRIMESIYQDVFATTYLKTMSAVVITEIVNRVLVLHDKIQQSSYDQYSSVSVSPKQSLLYSIFATIKYVYSKLSYKNYRQIITKNLGITLSYNVAQRYRDSLKKIMNDERTPSCAMTAFTVQEDISKQKGEDMGQF